MARMSKRTRNVRLKRSVGDACCKIILTPATAIRYTRPIVIVGCQVRAVRREKFRTARTTNEG